MKAAKDIPSSKHRKGGTSVQKAGSLLPRRLQTIFIGVGKATGIIGPTSLDITYVQLEVWAGCVRIASKVSLAARLREGKGYIAVPACGGSLAEAKRACNKVYKDKAFSQEV
eukprot:1140334-Pelagomonas_calceolata.AAC.1